MQARRRNISQTFFFLSPLQFFSPETTGQAAGLPYKCHNAILAESPCYCSTARHVSHLQSTRRRTTPPPPLSFASAPPTGAYKAQPSTPPCPLLPQIESLASSAPHPIHSRASPPLSLPFPGVFTIGKLGQAPCTSSLQCLARLPEPPLVAGELPRPRHPSSIPSSPLSGPQTAPARAPLRSHGYCRERIPRKKKEVLQRTPLVSKKPFYYSMCLVILANNPWKTSKTSFPTSQCVMLMSSLIFLPRNFGICF